MSKQDERQSFMSSHGRQTKEGRYLTYEELEGGVFAKTTNCLCYTVLIALLLLCLGFVYTVDIKQAPQRELIDNIIDISTSSVQGLYNRTAGIKNQILESIKVTGEKGVQLKDWIVEKAEKVYDDAVQIIVDKPSQAIQIQTANLNPNKEVVIEEVKTEEIHSESTETTTETNTQLIENGQKKQTHEKNSQSSETHTSSQTTAETDVPDVKSEGGQQAQL